MQTGQTGFHQKTIGYWLRTASTTTMVFLCSENACSCFHVHTEATELISTAPENTRFKKKLIYFGGRTAGLADILSVLSIIESVWDYMYRHILQFSFTDLSNLLFALKNQYMKEKVPCRDKGSVSVLLRDTTTNTVSICSRAPDPREDEASD